MPLVVAALRHHLGFPGNAGRPVGSSRASRPCLSVRFRPTTHSPARGYPKPSPARNKFLRSPTPALHTPPPPTHPISPHRSPKSLSPSPIPSPTAPLAAHTPTASHSCPRFPIPN